MVKAKKAHRLNLRISAEVAREIRRHARSNAKTEVCGVLVGSDSDGTTSIRVCIAGANAAQGGTHVTFTQDTWEHIYKIKDRDYPEERIVGWYHSHPGFGVFLSDHDTFIHQNFFSSPNQIAWVYDPHSDEEGCFGWQGERLERLGHFSIVDSKGGEIAGGSGRAEPRIGDEGEPALDWSTERTSAAKQREPEEDADLSRLARTVSAVFSHLAVFIMGGFLVWYLLPRILVMPVPVDPATGQPLHNLQELPAGKPDAGRPSADRPDSARPPSSSKAPDSSQSQRGDVHP